MLKRVFFAVKLIVTISVCIWIIWHVDWNQIWDKLRHVNLLLILIVVGLRFLGLTISAHKWQRLLAVHGLRYPMLQLQRWYLIAMFLNYFFPTSIGGDGYRIYKTLNNPKSKSCAVLAVAVERATGMMALFLMGYAVVLFIYAKDGDKLSGSLAVLGTAGILIALIGTWITTRWQLLQKLAMARACPKPINTLIQFAGDLRQHPREICLVTVISFIFHLIIILAFWLLIYALGDSCSLTELIVAVAVMNVIGLLPISLGGLGAVDGSFVYVMGCYGMAYETSLSAMLLWRFLLIPMNLVGAYFYCFSDRNVQATKPAIERT